MDQNTSDRCRPIYHQTCRAVNYSDTTFLGFDLSTQKLKAVVLNSELKVIYSAEVKYDTDLPEFGTESGAVHGDRPNEYLVNPVMWVKALDIVLNCLRSQGADMTKIGAISGSGQQHGSVYWNRQGFKNLCGLCLPQRLHEQINESCFAIIRTPIWMDGSTITQCHEMESSLGGALQMASTTGSKCYTRFTGPQIRKIYQVYPEAYAKTERISLVSSFLASLFIGNIANIDYSDGSGMNLLKLDTKTWSHLCLKACAPNLARRLMQPVKSTELVGHIHQYYVKRWGFRSDCMVLACTGDNPSSLAGMLLEKNSLIISLGTSDTIIMHLKEQPKLEEGHVLCHPTETNEYMGLLCFRNGSMVREAICDQVAGGSWKVFNEMLRNTPMGNEGNMALHFPDLEIVPCIKGTLRWNQDHNLLSENASIGVANFERPELEARAVIEGQLLHHRAVANSMGFDFGKDTKIIATGGASVNDDLLQVIADIFNSPVFRQVTACESALMGAAYRARYAFYQYREHPCNCSVCEKGPRLNYRDYIKQFLPLQLKKICVPHPKSEKIYKPMLSRYTEMIQILEAQTHLKELI